MTWKPWLVILSSAIFCISLKRQKSLYLKLWCTEHEDEKRTQHLFLHHEHPCVSQWPLFALHLGLPPAHFCHLHQSKRMGWPAQIEKCGNFLVACVVCGMVYTSKILAEELQSCVDNGEEILWNRFLHLLPIEWYAAKTPHTGNSWCSLMKFVFKYLLHISKGDLCIGKGTR